MAVSPTRLAHILRRQRDLVVSLSESDLRARYGRGPWRVLKWLVDPFALVGVYLVLVTVFLDRPGEAPGLSLVCAIVPFQVVMLAVTNGIDAVRLRRGIVANMAFARMLIPLAGSMTETLAFGASLLLFPIMMVAYGVAPTLAILALPLVIAVNLALAMALAYPATLVGVWVPDLRPFVVSFVRTLFFLAPGLVALDQIRGSANDIVKVNPFTGLFEAYRAVLLEGNAPQLWQLAWPLTCALVGAAIFVPIYRSEQRQFAKVLE